MRRNERARGTALAVLLALGACGPRPAAEQGEAARGAAGPGMCRVGPDGGPVLADRGIGGTGAPETTLTAERGIGGTGAPVREADRGIGGTGIVGVVTGFASVCLAGQEVALDAAVPVDIDGERAGLDQLRAGQVAVVEAEGAPGSLRARRVSIRHEVAGPVEAVEADRSFRVAGQRVALAPDAWGGERAGAGSWLAVSGLRGPDGTIQATRLDPRPPGDVLVRGTVQEAGGGLVVGGATLRGGGPMPVQTGHGATIRGRFERGVLYPTEVGPDLLAEDPVAFFGGSARRFVLEGVVTTRDGRVRLGRDLSVPAGGMGVRSGRAVLELERAPGGDLRLRSSGERGGSVSGPDRDGERGRGGFGPGASGRPFGGAGAPSGRFAPAPVPDRSFGEAGPGGRERGGQGPGSAARRTPAEGSSPNETSRSGGGWGPGGGFFPPGPAGGSAPPRAR